MKLLERILITTDFSQASESALKMAAFTAKTFQSEIFMIHVIAENQIAPMAIDMIRKTAEKQMESTRIRLEGMGLKAQDIKIVEGVPFEEITHYANSHDMNVLFAGSGERTTIEKFRLGTTGERLIRKSAKPVWIVRRDSALKVKHVLCPVDFSRPSERALKNAVHLARNFHADLTVLTVIPPFSGQHMGLVKISETELNQYIKQEEARFDRFLAKFDFHKMSWKKVVRKGKPHQEILMAAREGKHDLIVMGSVGRTGLARIFLGSVAEKVLRDAPCSIITVKSEHAIRLKLDEEIDDIRTCYKQGLDLLEKGFAEEAVGRLQASISKDVMFTPAWQALAEAYQRLGRDKEAEESREKARYIQNQLWGKQVQAEARKEILGRKKKN